MKYLIPIFVLIFLILPITAQAFLGPGFNPLLPLTDACRDFTGEYALRLCILMVKIQRLLYAIALGIAVIMIIIGGIAYMTAGGDEEKAKKGRKTITNGVIGFAIVIAINFILGIVSEIILSSFS